MSSILSALAPNRTSSTGAGGKEGELGQQSTKAQESLVQNSLDAASVERIQLPLLSDRGQKIFKLTPLLSKATLSPNEEQVAKRERSQRKIEVSVSNEQPEIIFLPQVAIQPSIFLNDMEVVNGYRRLRNHVQTVGYCASSSDEEDTVVPNEHMQLDHDIDPEAKDTGKDMVNGEANVDETRFEVEYNPIKYEAWEGRIVWQDDGMASENDEEKAGSSAQEQQHAPTDDAAAAMDADDDDDEIDWEKDDADSVEAGPSSKGTSLIPMDMSMLLPREAKPGGAWGSYDSGEAKSTVPGAGSNGSANVNGDLSLSTELNADLGRYRWLNAIVWDDLHPPKHTPSTHWLIVDENDTSIVSRMVEKEKDKRPRIAGSLSDVHLNGLHMVDETDAPTQRKHKGRKTREEKARGRDARLARLRAMGLLFDENEQRNDEAARAGQPLDASLAWKASLPKLPDAVRLQSAKPEMKPSEAQHFHRPRARYSRGDKIRIFYGEGTKGGVKKSLSLAFPGQKPVWKKKDLTARDGKLVLMEYSEEFPPLLSNAGMASNICNFWKTKTKDKEGSAVATPPQTKRGTTIVLSPQDKSPFLATLEPERLYTALHNKLFMAPIYEHTLADNEFLLVRPKRSAAQAAAAKLRQQQGGSSGKETVNAKAYLRKVDTIYVVGQCEPQVESFHPNLSSRSSDLRSFLNTFIAYHVLRKFNKQPGSTMSLQVIRNMFPSVNESTLNKAVRDVAERAEIGSAFVVRDDAPDESDFRKQLPPHLICRYESTQAGLQRLYDHHVYFCAKNDVLRTMQALQLFEKFQIYGSRVIRAFEEATGVKKFTDDERAKLLDQSVQEVSAGRFLVESLQLSPWFITSCYVNMHLRKGQPNNRFSQHQMRLEGFGDPSGRGEAVSFLPEADDSFLKKRGRRRRKNASGDFDEEEEEEDNPSKPAGQSGYGGTDFDLRKLSLPESAKLLRAHGIPQSQIELLDRWDRITVVESIASSKAGAAKLQEKFSKFARHNPKSLQETEAEKELFQKRINEIFKRQANALSKVRTTTSGLKRAQSSLGGAGGEDSDSDLDLVGDLEESLAKGNGGADDAAELEKKKAEEENELRKLTQLINDEGEVEEDVEEEQLVRIIPRSVVRPNKQILKRTVIQTMANGELRVRVYFVKTKREIEKFKSKQRKRAKESREDYDKLMHRLGLADGGDRLRSRDQRRLEYRERKAKREGEENFRWYKENLKKYGKDWPLTVKGVGARCSVCRLKGHAASSKSCPLYYTSFDKHKSVKMKDKSGLKLSINKKALLNASTRKSRKRGRERDVDLSKSKRSRGSKAYGEEDLYAQKKAFRSSRKAGRTARKGAKFDLNTKLKEIWQACATDRSNAKWFYTKVDKKRVPTYYDIIKKPMDLGKMNKRLEIFQYSSTAEFMNDLKQILDNAITFNGATSEISQAAEALVERADAIVNAEKSLFDHLDSEVERSGGAKKKKHRSSESSSSKPSPSRAKTKLSSYTSTIANPFMDDFDDTNLTVEDAGRQDGGWGSSAVSPPGSMPSASPGHQPQASPAAYESEHSLPMASPPATSPENEATGDGATGGIADGGFNENLDNLDLENLEGEVMEEEEEEELVM